MYCNLSWIFLLVLQLLYVASRPVENSTDIHDTGQDRSRQYNSGYEHSSNADNEQVISVRITSSVAVGRGKGKPNQRTSDNNPSRISTYRSSTEVYENNEQWHINNVPASLEGANIEFLKQLNAKKEKEPNVELHPFQMATYQKQNDTDYINERSYETTKTDKEYTNGGNVPFSDNVPSSSQDVDYTIGIDKFESSILDDALNLSNDRLTSNATDDLITIADSKSVADDKTSLPDTAQTIYDDEAYNRTDDSFAEPSSKSVLGIADKNNENYENIENVPLARSVPQSPSSKNYIQGLANKPPSERESSTRLTTVSFNVVHDTPNIHTNTYNNAPNRYMSPRPNFDQQQKFYEPPKVYSQPAQIYSEPAKFYSEPAKIYSEPAKIYSEPAKVYSEPAKIYSEPAKIYSEPAKIYSEPEKFYSEPASLHLEQNGPQSYTPWRPNSRAPSSSTTFNTTPITTITISDVRNTPKFPPEHQAEKNYEVDEKVSVHTDGRSHGVQESTTEKCKQDKCKVGYVVKGRQYNKYRVEERTSDGFIVGEYGVVRNEDGALRGVRYTADSEASPRLIYDALMKFLQLK